MKKSKKLVIVLGVVSLFFVSLAFANGAGVYARKHNIQEEKAFEMREQGKTFGQMAKEEGWFEDFQQEMLKMKEDWAKSKVEQGIWTQTEADEWLKTVQTHLNECDGDCEGQQGIQRNMKKTDGKGNLGKFNKDRIGSRCVEE